MHFQPHKFFLLLHNHREKANHLVANALILFTFYLWSFFLRYDGGVWCTLALVKTRRLRLWLNASWLRLVLLELVLAVYDVLVLLRSWLERRGLLLWLLGTGLWLRFVRLGRNGLPLFFLGFGWHLALSGPLLFRLIARWLGLLR